MAESAETPAGWYADPQFTRRLRYWDGTTWTDHVHAPPATPVFSTRRSRWTAICSLVVLGGFVAVGASYAIAAVHRELNPSPEGREGARLSVLMQQEDFTVPPPGVTITEQSALDEVSGLAGFPDEEHSAQISLTYITDESPEAVIERYVNRLNSPDSNGPTEWTWSIHASPYGVRLSAEGPRMGASVHAEPRDSGGSSRGQSRTDVWVFINGQEHP